MKVQHLGQSGFRFDIDGEVIFIDPYLSDSVAEAEGAHLHRLVAVPIPPEKVTDAGWVFITHDHLDHCDPATLLPVAQASPGCRFVGPQTVCDQLVSLGIAGSRITAIGTGWLQISPGLRALAVPAAHPEIQPHAGGGWNCIGYIFEYGDQRWYHSGDTFVTNELVRFLEPYRPFKAVMLPVNEHNYFRQSQNIIGNMSVRDAFGFAEILKAEVLIPMHWDMFAPNQVYREEIELIYRQLRPPFKLDFSPESL